MHSFMIGQYGGLDYRKYDRDFVQGFYGIEACLFPHEADITALHQLSQKAGFQVGVHFPLRDGISPLRDALFLASEDSVRMQAYTLIQQELEFIASIHPSYVLFHYPKPVILDDRVDWSRWHFSDPQEYVYECNYSKTELIEKSEALFEWLSRNGAEYHFTPVLELDALHSYIYNGDFFSQLLDQYPDIKLCLDTARLYMQDRIDPNFNSIPFVKQYARYAEVIHLSNIQFDHTQAIVKRRYPVLPRCKPEDGWAPIEQYLHIIRNHNPDVKIMFEHRSEQVSDEELMECYRWVNQLMIKE